MKVAEEDHAYPLRSRHNQNALRKRLSGEKRANYSDCAFSCLPADRPQLLSLIFVGRCVQAQSWCFRHLSLGGHDGRTCQE